MAIPNSKHSSVDFYGSNTSTATYKSVSIFDESLSYSSLENATKIQYHKLNSNTTCLDFNQTLDKKGTFIGKGACGNIYEYDHEGKSAVVKCCQYSTLAKKMDLIFEINALETINHPNIVRIFAYARVSQRIVGLTGTSLAVIISCQ